MAKTTKQEDKVFELTPEGEYHGTLIKVSDKTVDTKFGKKQKLYWIIDLTEVKRFKDKKPVFVGCKEDEYHGVKTTGLVFGPSKAELTHWYNMIMPFGLADAFIDVLSGDTDELVNNFHFDSVIIQHQRSETDNKPYANVTLAKPTDDSIAWLRGRIEAVAPDYFEDETDLFAEPPNE